MTTCRLLHLTNMPIFQQLQIEEALLRTDNGNWCIINEGSTPAIVMGISGKPEQHINLDLVERKSVPVIRRFSGGGTVYIDKNTCFFTLIGNRTALHFPCYPEKLLHWTEELYRPAFEGLDFGLKENDYVLGNKKFGGNALYIQKNRWLLHSSLLWDFEPSAMDYLLMPPKMPCYRRNRPHGEFLCTLREYFNTKDAFKEKMIKALKSRFSLVEASLEEASGSLQVGHRRTTGYLSMQKKHC